MSDLPPDTRGPCVHTPGLVYKGYALTCTLREHGEEYPHLCFVPPGSPEATEAIHWTSSGLLFMPIKYAMQPVAVKEGGYTGDICDNCSSTRMIRNGSCLLCTECGSTTGCS